MIPTSEQPSKPLIILATVNARYQHAAFALRYLRANLAQYREHSCLMEFTLEHSAHFIVEAILSKAPKIVGMSVYIWNVDLCTHIVQLLKCLAPEVIVVLGGPEVSYEAEQQDICCVADYVVSGWGEVSFFEICDDWLSRSRKPLQKFIAGKQAALDTLTLPYDEYTDEDITNRVIYVEASRGCPFKCEFCLSSLDKTAWAFPLEPFLAALDSLYQRGARAFKFVDRTFNLKPQTCEAILRFFLARLDHRLFLHFELIPDRLPESLKNLIVHFPAQQVQFEIGIQTFNPEVQKNISRVQDDAKAQANITFLRDHAHLHTDLIFGLPGESLESFAHGFDRLYRLRPHEIQLGVLKRLRGAPIKRWEQAEAMVFDSTAPYPLLQNRLLPYAVVQRVVRMASYWDKIVNSGRFKHSSALLLAEAPFMRFLLFSDWCFARVQRTHQIALESWFYTLDEYLTLQGNSPMLVRQAIYADFATSGAKSRLKFDEITNVKTYAQRKKRRMRQQQHSIAAL